MPLSESLRAVLGEADRLEQRIRSLLDFSRPFEPRLRMLDLEDWDLDARFLFIPRQEVILYPPFDRFVRAASWLLMAVVGLVRLATEPLRPALFAGPVWAYGLAGVVGLAVAGWAALGGRADVDRTPLQ